MPVTKISARTEEAEAWCEHELCDWAQTADPLARSLAKRHAQRTGHIVAVIVAKIDRYQLVPGVR